LKAADSAPNLGVPRGPYPLDWLEIAFGSPIGIDDSVAPVEPSGDPALALESLVVEALGRPPCLVTFSGGRDSSAVLAAAVAAARQHGLEEPIPSSMRFPELPDSVEDDWQERVIRHVGLTEWHIVEPGDTLGFLDTIATGVLNSQGLLWPPNAHFMMPSIRAAAGGSVLTGAFGDEIFTEDSRRTSARKSRYVSWPRSPRVAARVAVTGGPRAIRLWDSRRRVRSSPLPPWLSPEAAARVRQRLANQMAFPPLRWDRAATTFPRLRYVKAGLAALRALGVASDTTVSAPLGEARFVAAVAKAAGKVGFAERTVAMRKLFGHLLPDDVLSRTSKASFGRALWGTETMEFARRWDGSGLPREVVDVDVLRATWMAASDMSAPLPDFAHQSATALHAAYLAS